MQFVVEPVWGWTITILVGILMLGVVAWTYPSRIRRLPPFWQRLLLGLRLLTALVLLFAAFRPAVEYREQDKQGAQLVVLADKSRSMETSDTPGELPRREALRRTLQENSTLLDELAQKLEIRYLDFDSLLFPASFPLEDLTDGQFTAIGKVIDLIREDDSGKRVVSIFLMSDGAQRAGGEDDIDPRSAIRRFAEQRGIPINTICYGTSELSSSGLDLAIEELSLDQPVTFERKTVPVRFQLRMLGAAGRPVKVRLLVEDRTGVQAGTPGVLKELPLSESATPFRTIETVENAALVPVELSFVAERPGDYKVVAEVVPQEGELKQNNNRLETLITVRKGGLKVAYFEVPRFEQRFLRELNDTAKIQLDMQVILPGDLARRTILSPKLFEPRAYDVYIIGDVPASAFQQQGKDLLAMLAQRVNEGAGLAMLGGIHNYSAGGYGASPLKNLLPVTLAPQASSSSDPSPEDHFLKPIQMLPTLDGERHYLMRLSSTDNERTWRGLPKMKGANRLTPRTAVVDVLAESAEQDPLLIASDTGRGRVLALAVDETWKWHLHGFGVEHQRFWQQLMLWLARKEFDSDQQVWARVEPRRFPPLAKVPIEYGAQNDEGLPIPDATYQVDVTTPDGKVINLSGQRVEDHALAEFSETALPGDYWIRVSAKKDGALIGLAATTRFLIDARDIETENPAADPDLMQEIATVTGGQVIPPERFGETLQVLLDDGFTTEMMRYRRYNLWDDWPLMIVFVLLLSIEWFLRKTRGLV